MKYAEAQVPNATTKMHARCSRRGSLSHPKTHKPRNVDSRKKAAMPSTASGAPNTSPT